MNPSRPYIARGLYEWILDNDCTPHLVVDAEAPHVVVPRQFVQDGQIVLNVLPSAVRDFFMGGNEISFSARFGGVPMQVRVPYAALMAIFAKENAMGMGFGMEPGADYYERLQPVDADEAVDGRAAEESEKGGESVQPSTPKRPKPGRPSLKVVK
ncbi:ClpXP protease specificity-enhancing factor [Marinobacterium sedimentorum]|uniref:ClpXP protease specificity-enhancing factor n=1 Tax=Marinobacterium sedimentorum TaxID=2927804 RepID=UPI0020C632F4|nr:ClpXP protease specificity-enhancing factor [Marinobacterium sedimentorum]MCP8689592.1 ClpXP protease specificity-enhancing factor [Marinobacterium sedimentorum]